MRANNDYQQNNANKRGIVVDRDPKKMRVKVQFKDEDDTVSFWVDVLSRSSGKTKSFMMPDVDDEVWCAVDLKGEDGCIIGSKYNDKDTPPFEGNDDVGITFPGGSIHIDREAGAVTINVRGAVKIQGSSIDLVSETLTHNGKNVGHDHLHTGVIPGGDLTGEPA
ncbi:phage baseplate assembly protein V [Rhizobium herbae]|uniref:Phage baseplate assembly protein gpV n=1 Tax=Rhizobium herbae TaxID=508661 RepID=A0ABS4EW01_9HYPH|nr:phage baseplate assembly protein V [Rhizobium herbae]MBP1862135.1 phage baseplate assembly protein gpV [Rhizobium herbae]